MTNRRSRIFKSRSKSLRFQQRDQARRETLRSLQVETLEERQLLAANLELVGLQPDGGAFIEDGDVRDISPATLRFIFSGNQSIDASTLDAIQVTRAGGDGSFGEANDISITPGYVGLGDVSNEVLLRFSEALPDDEYRIDIFGTGDDALKNTDGGLFNGGEDQQIHFRLDLGAQVIAVVPQPIEEQGGSLVQQRDQIIIYFNDDDLYVPDAENADLYQLIFTGDTVNNADDIAFTPDSVSYDADTDSAVLTFSSDIHELIDPGTGDPIGAGTFRIRVGTTEVLPPAPNVIAPIDDIGSSFGSPLDLGTLAGQSQLVMTQIDSQPFFLDYPGANDEPGHREIPEETAGGHDNHLNPLFGADATDGVTTILYNFKADYGVDDQGNPLKNLITDTQTRRAREAFEVWGKYIGVQFVETADQGLTIVTGDPHALDPDADDVVNHALEKPIVDAGFMVRIDPSYQDSLLILDNAKQWNDDFGADWYKTTMTGIGFMLGLERATDLPPSTLMAYASDFTYPGATTPESIFPGNHDILHGQFLHRPDSNDIDMYRFEIAPGEQGIFTAETFAERQPNSSLLDSVLVLYRENADGSREIIARNDDYYSEDSYIELRLATGTYYLGVSASGNDLYNPEFEDTGFGGKSQGRYDLRVDFRADPEPGDALRDATAENLPGTVFDGNADGTPGGAYNFWFRAVEPANTIIVDKLGRPAEAGTKGTFQTISSALTVAAPGDIVRIVGNAGADGDDSTLTDNFAYEIGPGPLQNQILADGKTLDVPKGVVVMVDAGAIFKMNQSRIGVGSSSLTVDRSGGAFQVLGTPGLPVYFTSYDDESVGVDTYQPTTTPRPGNWGGIVFRNDFDNAEERINYEDLGLFLNYVNHADIRYGGGNVDVNSLRQIVTPVQMLEARPTITSNVIKLSADAPMSADPDSFEETNFHAPKFQLRGLFTSDYQRVGPQLHGNLLVENSSNGLFISITTPAGDAQKRLTVPARFDDTDVVHIISENLRIQGKSGEPILELDRPPIDVVTVAPQAGGALAAATYNYKLIFVDSNGFEGRPSEATNAVTLSGANNAVMLDKLPAAGGDFTARRIYRSVDGVAGPYVFVDQINSSDAVYVDTIALEDLDTNNTLQRDVPTVLGVTLSETSSSNTLDPGTYNYRITYRNALNGTESPSSDPTVSWTLPATSAIEIKNLVTPNTNGFDQIRIYRSQSDGAAPYLLAGEIAATETTFVDDGDTIDEMLDPITFGVARARPDARLAIDPGTIVKLEGSRIETTFGSQLIAEGREGREIIFTSRSDDRFGAGGTFDTNGDGDTATPIPGAWGGLYFGPLGTASIDYSLLTFGGGVTKIEGTFKAFNVLEIHQADVRLAHSVVEQNADGQSGQGPAERFGRGTNESATIFVRGAQPILVDNIIQNNDALALTINANSFTSDPLPDTGRSTGEIALAGQYSDNVGPLIRGNQMLNNPLNAVDIRGEVLTTNSIWDDTDIVHVLRSIEDTGVVTATAAADRFAGDVGLSDVNDFYNGRYVRFVTGPLAGKAQRVFDYVGSSRSFTFINPFSAVPGTGDTFEVLPSGGQIIVPDFHSNVGLRLQSSPSASLVVKLDGPGDNFDPALGAGFTATGRQLDIDDRIGGTMQVIGQPDFPVILTSLRDDTVGAGFTPDGQTLTDTNNDGWNTLPAAGDWRSVRIDQFANDRNVELVLETETPNTAAPGENATPDNAQHLGELAASEQGGDDNLRLGFEVHGVLNERNDMDVYSFEATAGTEVWLDIDRTTNTLNSVVELIDSDGTVVARSDDSFMESQDPSKLFYSASIPETHVNPLQKLAPEYQPLNASGLPKDHYSLNQFDAGMRVVMPGVVGVRSTYHIRVRSSSNDLNDLSGGLTTGSYQLQIRLREIDEVPGVTVRYADVRYATNGIELFGLPGHSPLLGEVAEDEEVGGPEHNGQVPIGAAAGTGPQDIGNLLETDRATISIAGNIHSLDDLDFYEMQLAYAATSGTSNQNTSVVFDVDYASGLSRPDTIVSVFDSFGRLVLIGRDSNVADDRSGALDDGNLSDLSRGSLGALDPFIGPVEMPEATYFVAVTSNARIPSQLLSNPDLRLEPVNTVVRVAEDHIGSSGGSTGADPQVPLLLDEQSIMTQLAADTSILILSDNGNDDEVLLSAAGLANGVVTRTVGPYPGKVQDLATRKDGNTFVFTTPDVDPVPGDDTTGILRGLNVSAPQYVGARDDGIETYNEDPLTPGVAVPSNVGIRFHAVTYGDIDGQEQLFAVGSRGDADTPPSGPTRFTNILYRFNSRTGEALSAPQQDRTGNARMQGAGTQIVERGFLDTNAGNGPGGLITGLSIQNNKLYALSDTGGVFLVQSPFSIGVRLKYIGDVIPNAGVIADVETNNDLTEAQDLDREVWTKRFDVNIGDTTTNTSVDIKHISVEGTGDDAFAGFFIRGESGGLDQPQGSVFNPADGNFYVASAGTNEILRYDGATGEFIDVFVTGGSGGLDGPADILFGADGNLYVASTNTDSVMQYSGTSGAFISAFVPSGDNGLDGPTGMVHDLDGNLLVASSNTDEVLRFNGGSGSFMNVFVQAGDGGLASPSGLTYGPDGQVYIASQGNNSILRFDGGSGVFDQTFVPGGSGNLVSPSLGIQFGPDGHLYVSSLGSDQVIRYHGQSGAVIDAYVAQGADSLSGPTNLLFDANGSLLVNSSNNDRVLVYNDDVVDLSWQWQAEPTIAGDIDAGDFAGSGVDLLGDTLVVGAPGDDAFGVDAGAVFVYERDDNATPTDLTDDLWNVVQKLSPADASNGDQFGVSVALDGDLLAIGAWTEDHTPDVVVAAPAATLTTFSGTAGMSDQDGFYNGYQLTFTSGALAGQTATIANYTGATRTFTLAAALPSIPAVGTDYEVEVPNAGAIYAFRYDGTNWIEEAKLKVSDPRPDRMLGRELAAAVDTQGDTIVAGAPREIFDAGSVNDTTTAVDTFDGDASLSDQDDFYNGFYMRFESGPLAGEAQLITDYVGNNRTFTLGTPFSVAPNDGDTFEILQPDSGSAYIFRFDGAAWFEQEKLIPSDTALLDMFGRGVDVEAGTVLVGAPNSNDSGAVYRFERDDSGTADPTDDTWTEVLTWQARDGVVNDKFGWSVALEGDRSIVAALRADDGAANGGAAYVLLWETDDWTQVAKLTAPDASTDDRFGESLDLEGNRLLVGAPDGDVGVSNSGSLYLFEVDDQGTTDPFDDVWDVAVEVATSQAAVDNDFGTSVALDGDRFVGGDPNYDFRGMDAGTAQVYVLDDLTQGTFEDFFVPSGTGGLASPRQIIVGPNGMVYVASATTDRILRFDGDTGELVDVFVDSGSGGLDRPEGIAFGPDTNGDDIAELFVTSRGTDQVLRYDGDTGAFIDVFAEFGITRPTGLVFGPDASGDDVPELYVSGFSSDNVVEFDGATGAFLRQFVPPGRGGLDGPVALEFRADGMLYVASSNSDSILRYDADTGAFVDDFIPSGLGGLDQPEYFVFGPDANDDGDMELYVTSFADDSVYRYNAVTGALVDQFVYSGNEGLDGPTGITFTADGYVIVASSRTDTVMRFDTAGTPTFDYFHFTVENDGDRGFFDIDFGFEDGDPGSFDAEIFILDASGAIVASNDNEDIRFGQRGSSDPADSFVEFVFPTAGEYYLVVGESDSDVVGGIAQGNRPDLTDTYTLHFSIENFVGASLEGMTNNMVAGSSTDSVFMAIDRRGDLFAFSTDDADTAVTPERSFFGARSRIPTGVRDAMGIALTTSNLWHITDARHDDKGHGLTNVFDDSRGSARVIAEREPNDTPATAQDLELEFWSLGYNSNIGDASDPPINTSTTIPHVTIDGSGDGTRDYYSFEVATAGALGIFDIDMDFDEQQDPGWFMDAEIRLLDEYGNLITWVEDAVLPTDGDGGKETIYDPPQEPYLEWIFAAPGTYVLEVTKFVNPFIWQIPETGDFYTLQVSVEEHRVDGPASDGGQSFFFGPELTGTITDVAPGDPVVITSPGHGLEDGQRVDVQDVMGIPGANGTWIVASVDEDAGTFELEDSDTDGTYLGGGTWRLLQMPEDVGGRIVSEPFSLLGYSAEDLPVLYFNYLLDADAAPDVDIVSVSIIDGSSAPIPLVVKGNGLVNAPPNATDVELGTPPTWLQARVELNDYANHDNLRLVFEFDSADSVASGFEGFFIDDIIIGFAERGEMVSYAYNDPSFTVNPDSETTDALTGPYQLEIRPGNDPGPSRRPTAETPNSQVLTTAFDTNERLTRQTTLVPPAGGDVTDGLTFTISDGIATLTFEYDDDGTVAEGNVRVPFEASFTTQQIGASIRDAINSPSVQSTIGVIASLSAGTIRGTTFADGTTPTEPLYQLVDLAGNAIVTDIQHIMYDGFGDVNRFRDQGQVLIHSSFVTDSRDFGIVVDAGVRDVEPRLATALLEPHAGAVRNLRELNNEVPGGVAPGVVVENNVITNEGLGGIHASGNLAPFEIIAPTDTLVQLSGERVRDGWTFTVHANRTTVTFEFEDISGGSVPSGGSGIQGGNGWREGNIPVFYRQSGSNYLAPPWFIPPRPYVQSEMATAIRDAIQSSILVTNGTTLHANASLESSRWLRHALTGLPLVSVYLDNVSSIDVSRAPSVAGRQTPLGASAQPFHRILNNTIYGNDGLQAFYPGSGLDEPNDRMVTAVETWQGRQHNPEFFQDDAVIGDSIDTLNDISLDVDFYRFQLEIGERVTVDIDAAPVSPLDSILRLFDAAGTEVAFNDNGTGPGETGGNDAFIDFTATRAGTYYVAVSGKGNENYDPLSLGSRTGPASVGDYHVEINVMAPRTFVITAQDGTLVPDGTTFTVSDINGSVTYEFDDVNAPGVVAGNIPIVYDSRPVRPPGFTHRGPGYRAPEMAVAMANTIGQGLTGVSAVALGGIQGASGPLPSQIPAIQGDTSVFGFPGFGHDSPFTPPRSTGELYVVVTGASSITGNVLFQPLIDENIDQLLPETGILVSEAASPTLLNNVLSNLNAGIWQDASPSTVVGASVYQHNDQADSNVGSTNDDFNLHLGNYDRLFVNAANGDFYPARFSPIIDSAIDSLEERVRLATVKGAVGIPVSPILAPNLDAAGLLRSDDPEVDTPLGQGANVFKDRGGLDRADFVGPDAVLIVPRDNDAAGLDLDPATTIVQLAAGSYDNFSVQLVDGLQASDSGEGVGVNDLTVNSSNITLTADGQLLKEDIDYSFRYNAITNTMRFTPLAGEWDNGKAYVITLPNEDRFVVEMPDGSQVTDGETFVITDEAGGTVTFEFESGYSLFVPETLALSIPEVGKGAGGIEDGQRFTVSTGFFGQYTFEYDNNSPPSFLPGDIPIDISTISTQDELAQATIDALLAENIGVVPIYLGDGQIHFGAPATYSVDTGLTVITQSGQPGVVADGDTILVSDGINPTVRFEFDSNSMVAASNIAIPFSLASAQDDISNSIAATIGGAGVGLTPTYFGAGHVHLGGTPDHRVVIAGTPNLTRTGLPGVRSSTTLIVPPQAAGVGGVADAQWFSIQDGTDTPVRFEFDNDGVVTPGSRAILFTNTSTVDQLSNYIISAIELANVNLTPQYDGGGFIALQDTIHHRTDTLNTNVDQFGVPGGVVTIEFLPDASFDAAQMAPLVLDAIAGSELTAVTTTFRGGNTYFVNGVKSISGLQNFFISAIADNAGNILQPNQASNQTRFTILMPDVESDYGDAPDSYGTLFSSIGARHVISDSPLLLGLGVTTEDDGQPSAGADADEDDGVDLSMSVFNEFVDTPVVVYATGRGLLDAWIDFNRDGDWSDPGEQVFASEQLAAGDNQLLVSTPSFAGVGETYARFRLSTLGGLGPAGLATDGEVEDYLIRIEPGLPPVAVDDTGFSVDEDATLVIDPADLLQNDTDADTPHNQLEVRQFVALSQLGASIAWDGSGNVVYDPTNAPALQALKPGEQATDSFAYQTSDGVLPSNWANVAVVVHGVNSEPVAVPDDYATDEDTALQIAAPGVLDNDYDSDAGDTLVVSAHDATSTMGATVTVNSDGSFTYDPTAATAIQQLALGDTATDTFSYTIEDDLGASSSTTVNIALTGLNDAPTAIDDGYAADEDTVLNVSAPGVLDNDSDIDGDTFGVSAADATSQLGAAVTVNLDGSFSYDPTAADTLQDLAVGESLDDTFSYTIIDIHGATAMATVTVTVDGRNDAPVALDDNYTTPEDEVLTVTPDGVVANDTDRDGDALSVDVATTDTVSALGVPVVVSADGGFTYDPTGTDLGLAPGDTADDTFTYTVTDPHGGTDTALVTIEVTGVNNAPIATDKTYDTNEDTVLDIDAPGVMTGDTDPDGQTIAIDSYDVTSVWGASVVVNADGSFSYDPTGANNLQALNVGTTVTDSFTYTIVDNDPNPKSDTATIFVDVDGVNDPPLAVDDAVMVPRNGSAVISVLDNDSDIDGTLNTSTVTIGTTPAHGTATVLANGTIRYIPANNFSGSDSLTYTVRDNSGAESNAAVVSLRVNAAPVAVDDVVETFLNVPTTIDVLANDSDIDGTLDPATLTIVDQPDHGSVSITASHKVVYTPDTGFTGNDAFTYTVDDNDGVTSNVASVAISMIVDPFPWQNPSLALDVNADTFISPIDALLVITELNENGGHALPNPPVPPFTPPPFLDPSGDNLVSPLDALLVISYLNGEGEAEGEGEALSALSLPSVHDNGLAGIALFAATASQSDSIAGVQAADSMSEPVTVTEDGLVQQVEQVDLHGAALQDYLASWAQNEDLEELLEVGHSLQQEDVLEDQALLELLAGTDVRK